MRILTLSGVWNDLVLDTSSIGLFVFKSITGANLGAVKVLLDLFNVGVNVAFGGPLFGVKGFFCDCNIFKPLDQPTANSVGGAPRSSSSYKLISFAFRQSQFQKHDEELFKMDFVYNLQFFTNFSALLTDRDPKSSFGIKNFGCPNSMNTVLYRSRYLRIFDNFD